MKLRDLGYSNYGIHTIPCNDVSAAKKIVSAYEVPSSNIPLYVCISLIQVDEESSKCDSWMRKLDYLLSEFKWLSFFTIPKLLLIHSALIDERTSKRELMLEFYHIFKRDNKTWKVVEHAAEVF